VQDFLRRIAMLSIMIGLSLFCANGLTNSPPYKAGYLVNYQPCSNSLNIEKKNEPEKYAGSSYGSKKPRLNLIFAFGRSCSDDHGNGVWYQEGFSHVVKLCSNSWEVGIHSGAWTFGYTNLLKTWSDAIALTHDSYYDIANKRCKMHCDRTVRVIADGKVDGLYLRHEWLYGPWVVEAGLLFFHPRHTVYLSDFGEIDVNGVQHMKNVRVTHQNIDEYKLTPSIGGGYRHVDFTVMLRYYPWVKSTGDRYLGNNTYRTLTSLYSGPVLQAMLQYEF